MGEYILNGYDSVTQPIAVKSPPFLVNNNPYLPDPRSQPVVDLHPKNISPVQVYTHSPCCQFLTILINIYPAWLDPGNSSRPSMKYHHPARATWATIKSFQILGLGLPEKNGLGGMDRAHTRQQHSQQAASASRRRPRSGRFRSGLFWRLKLRECAPKSCSEWSSKSRRRRSTCTACSPPAMERLSMRRSSIPANPKPRPR